MFSAEELNAAKSLLSNSKRIVSDNRPTSRYRVIHLSAGDIEERLNDLSAEGFSVGFMNDNYIIMQKHSQYDEAEEEESAERNFGRAELTLRNLLRLNDNRVSTDHLDGIMRSEGLSLSSMNRAKKKLKLQSERVKGVNWWVLKDN